MIEENPHLSEVRARQLTVHGMNQNEDGSLCWKFDNYLHAWSPVGITPQQLERLWGRIERSTLLVYGAQSWASSPADDGRAGHFSNAQVSLYGDAGHWVHHDQLDAFVSEVRTFPEYYRKGRS